MLERRDFLKLIAAGFGAAASISACRKIEQAENYIESLDYLDGLKAPPYPVPEDLKGLTINSPFLYTRDSNYILQTIQKAKAFGAKNIRVFVGDNFEPKIGSYNPEVINNIRELAAKLDGIKLIVSLFDSYTLFHSNKPNGDYPPSPLSSPYHFANPGNFFTDQNLCDSIDKRYFEIIKSLKDIPQISAWEVANEPETDSKNVLTNWYGERVDLIRSFDNRAIITGLARPWLIDDSKFKNKNVINSFHAYPFQTDLIQKLSDFAPKSVLPLAGLEVGVGQKLEPKFSLPLFVYQVFESVIKSNTLYSQSIGLWKLDEGMDDYDISGQNPRYLSALSKKLTLY